MLLGVTLDNKLTFKTHFEHIINKMRKGLNALRFTKTLLNYRAKILIYNGLIKPTLDYCHLVWISKLSNSQIKQMTTLQTRLKILPVLTREHYTSLLHWV
jgi:hypothetical protein